MAYCVAICLFCVVGKPLISDESIRAALAKARAKVARVSEYPPPPAMPALEVEAGDVADVEQLSKDAERCSTKLCRTITHGISTSGGDTPRVAIIIAIGPGPLVCGQIRHMASQGRCPTAVQEGTCRPWVPVDRWDMPDEDAYVDSPEVDFLKFIAGIVDAIGVVGSWDEFIIPCVPGKALARASQYRNVIVATACMILWGCLAPLGGASMTFRRTWA